MNFKIRIDSNEEKDGTENLVFTSIDVDTLIEMIGDRVINVMLGNTQARNNFFKRHELLKTRISEINTSVRLYNCLKWGDIQTLEDLTKTTEKELWRIRNFGIKSLTEVKNILKEYGLTLKQEQYEN
jgi:DNA-directed RNA polymerase alpha subunit